MNHFDANALAKLPPLYSQEAAEDPIVYVKFFTPDAGATWWLTEYDPEQKLAFGYTCLGDPEMAELGYVSLEELQELRGPMNLPVERDLYFKPTPLSEIKKQLRGTN